MKKGDLVFINSIEHLWSGEAAIIKRMETLPIGKWLKLQLVTTGEEVYAMEDEVTYNAAALIGDGE